LGAVVILAGCYKDNRFCPNGVCPSTPDGSELCTQSHDDCVCLESVCVDCTVDDERNCTVDKPQCGDDIRCRGCRANSECASDACLETGFCADTNQVV
jgi:hypothetical protein